MQKIAIIIPCYNEEARLSKAAIQQLHDTGLADIYLCNDGSTDGTAKLISNLSATFNNCFALQYEQNSGKANTIYKSVNTVLAMAQYDYIGYFDADFSTPVHEITNMLLWQLKNPEKFLIGSRVKLLNHAIKRKVHRHIIGRIIITLVNLKLKLGIYDTQCGAKIFPALIAKEAFYKPFSTSWLFDIEVFIRLKKNGQLILGEEFPLKEWTDIDGSKLSWKTGFKILKELYILQKL